MDFGDDFRIDLGRLVPAAAGGPAGGRLGLVTDRALINPLLGLAALDLGLLTLRRDRRTTWTALGAYVRRPSLGLVAWFGATVRRAIGAGATAVTITARATGTGAGSTATGTTTVRTTCPGTTGTTPTIAV